LERTLRHQTAATKPPFDFGGQRRAMPGSSGQPRSRGPWVIVAAVPCGLLTISTRASIALLDAVVVVTVELAMVWETVLGAKWIVGLW